MFTIAIEKQRILKLLYKKITDILTEEDLSVMLAEKVLPLEIDLHDHLGGFDKNYRNPFYDRIHSRATEDGVRPVIKYTQFLPTEVQEQYPNLDIKFWLNPFQRQNLAQFMSYRCPPLVNYQNFICSFNGIGHVSRQFLTAALGQRRWFNARTCSKNFRMTVDSLDGHLQHYAGDNERLLRKFFIYENCDELFRSEHTFGHNRSDHRTNVENLSGIITSCFVNVVSETVATSYASFVTEKCLYSVTTRGLFVGYAPLHWHRDLEKYYGILPYNKIFNYAFDSVTNPVERLVELCGMLSKFERLSKADLTDLYDMERDTIEHNYDQYYSGAFLKRINDADYIN